VVPGGERAWEGRAEGVPLTTWVREKLDELHAPIRQLFENTITEELRNEVEEDAMTTVDQSIDLFEQQGTASEQINTTTHAELAVRTGKVARSRRRFFPIRWIRRRAKSTSCTPRPSRRRSGRRHSISNQNHSRVS
jgi:hypothetical protein